MMLGALGIGTLTDLVGRRKALIGSVVVVLVVHAALRVRAERRWCSGSCASSPGWAWAAACPPRSRWSTSSPASGRSGRATTTMMTGYHVGAVLTARPGHPGGRAAGLALDVRDRRPARRWSWCPLMLRFLPESAVLPGRPRPAGRGRGGRPHPRPDAGGRRPPRSPSGRATPVQRRGRHAEDAVQPRLPAQHRRHRRHLVHGPAARLRPQQLAADDHAGGRVRARRDLRVPAGPQRRGDRGPARRGHRRRPDRHPHRRHDLVRLRRAVPRPAVGTAVHAAALPDVLPRPAASCSARRCWSTRSSAPTIRRRCGRPRSGWSAGAGRSGAIVGPVITGALVTAGIAFPWGFYVFAVVGALGALAFSVTMTRGPPDRTAARWPCTGRAGRRQSRGRLRSWSARNRSNSAPISSALGTSPELPSRSVPSRAAVKLSYCCSSAATTAVFSLDRPICSSISVRLVSRGLAQRLGRQVQPGQPLEVLEQRERGGRVGGLGQVVRHVRGHARARRRPASPSRSSSSAETLPGMRISPQ